ncbi:MAG TPA: hypothetical protein VH012_08685 [Acidimicrobiales bacterium]|jgi:hypothetical protein|nr:hypothetical protein [Acidimicrobiales bacterium]
MNEVSEPQRPPAPGGISMRPAMIVVGLAALILVLFVTIGIVSSQSPAAIKHTNSAVGVPGITLRALPAASLLTPITSAGEPPNNILNAVSVPVGSVRTTHQNNTAGAGQYDAQVSFSSGESQAALVSFYAADMKLQGWQISDRGAARNQPNALEVLGKLAGSDGYYWELGATVNATTFPSGGPPRGTTTFTVRLFQVPDPE